MDTVVRGKLVKLCRENSYNNRGLGIMNIFLRAIFLAKYIFMIVIQFLTQNRLDIGKQLHYSAQAFIAMLCPWNKTLRTHVDTQTSSS